MSRELARLACVWTGSALLTIAVPAIQRQRWWASFCLCMGAYLIAIAATPL